MNRGLKRLCDKSLKILIIMILMLGVIGSTEGVKAEDTEIDKVTPSSIVDTAVTDGNIYNMAIGEKTENKKIILETALQYDPRVHYLLTYAFLKDEFGVGTEESLYKKVTEGTNEISAVVFKGLETNPENVVLKELSRLGELDEVEVSTYTAEITDETKDDEKFKKETDEFANRIVNEYIIPEMIGKVYAPKKGPHEKLEEKYFDVKDALSGVSNDVGDWLEGMAGSYKRSYLGYYYNLRKLDYSGGGRFENYVKEEIRKSFKNELSNQLKNNLGNEDVDVTEIIRDNIQRVTSKSVLESIAYNYRTNAKLKKIKAEEIFWDEHHTVWSTAQTLMMTFVPGLAHVSGTAPGLYLGQSLSSINPNSWGIKEYYYITAFLPEYPRYLAKGMGKPEDDIREDIQNKFKEIMEDALKKDAKLKGYIKKYNDTYMKKRKEDKKVADNVDKNNRIVGWVPLYPELDPDGDFKGIFVGNLNIFNQRLKNTDGTTYRNGAILLPSGEARPVKLTDLFYSKSSSPVLTFNTKKLENNYAQVKVGLKGDAVEGVSLGRYAGIQTKASGKSEKYEGDSVEGYNLSVFRKLSSEADSYKPPMDVTQGNVVGLDNYGNIINGDTGTVLIPYWQNEVIKSTGIESSTGNNEGYWVSHPGYNKEATVSLIQGIYKGSFKAKETGITKEDVRAVFGEHSSTVDNVFSEIGSISSVSDLINYVQQGGDELEQRRAISNLAMAIVAGTSAEIKELNKEIIQWGRDSATMHIRVGVDGYWDGTAGSSEEGYSNKDLRERIMYHLDYGFFDLIKLTTSSWFESFYSMYMLNSVITNVFYTKTLVDTDIWEDIVGSLVIWLVGLLGVYIIYMAFLIFRQSTFTIKDFIQQFLVVTLIIMIPTVIYSPLINLVINKPTPWVMGKQLQQLAVLDYYQEVKDHREKEVDPAYAILFGGKHNIRERSQDYIITFYTTQHKNGYFIDDPETAKNLTFTDMLRSSKAKEHGIWNEKDIVKVNVSMFDLFKWVRLSVDETKDGESKITEDFFTWLRNPENTVGDYTGISEYVEYAYDPNIINRNLGILGEELQGVENITASELFKELYATANYIDGGDLGLLRRLKGLNEIAAIIKKNDPKNPVTREEVDTLIRDLSLTRDSREVLFGTSVASNRVELEENVVNGKRVKAPAVSSKTVDFWDRTTTSVLTVPNSDYLSLEDIIDKVNPETSDPRRTTNAEHVYNVNNKILNDYINVHHIVRESMGNNRDIQDSEFMMVMLNKFFRINEELDIKLFPRLIQPDTYTIDTYMRMVYVPVSEYKDSESKGLQNIGEYLALRDNVVVMFIVVVTLFALALWGLLYMVVFGFVLVILSMISFIWNYVIKISMDSRRDEGKESKAWLNVITIIITFGIAKMGLLALWWGMYYTMNESNLLYGGQSYPYSFIHSIIILAYLLVAYWFLLHKMLMNFIKQPMELGGEQLLKDAPWTQAYNNTRDYFSPEAYAKRKADRAAKRQERKDAAAKKKKEAEESGEVPLTALGRITSRIARARDIAKKAGTKTRSGMTSLKNMANGLISPDDESLIEHGGYLSRQFNKLNAKGFEKMDGAQGKLGIGADDLAYLKESGLVGQVLSSTVGGEQLEILRVGNMAMAESLKRSLSKKGVKAEVNGDGDVVFNSTGIDLTEGNARKYLFGDLVNSLVGDLNNLKEVTRGDVDSVIPYSYNTEGDLQVKVGADGISSEALGVIMNSKEFEDAFTVRHTPGTDWEGNYTNGYLEVTPKRGVDVEKAINAIVEKDDSYREFNGIGEREIGGQGYRSLAYEGIEKRKDIQSAISGIDGMYLQDGQLVYDYGVKEQADKAKEIEDMLRMEYENEYKDKVALQNKAMAYVSKGGNQGFAVDSYRIGESEAIDSLVSGAGLVRGDIQTKVYAGEGGKTIGKGIKKLQGLASLGVEERDNFEARVEGLAQAGNRVFLAGAPQGQKYDVGLNRLIKAATEAGADSGRLKRFTNQYSELGKDRMNADITEKEYQDGVKGLYKGLHTSIKEQGLMSKVVSSRIVEGGKAIANRDQQALDNYIDAKRAMEKKGVTPELFEKFSKGELGEVVNIAEKVGEIESLGEGIVNISSDSEISQTEVAKLIKVLQGEV